MKPINVLVADDSILVRAAIIEMLSEDPDIRVIGEGRERQGGG